MKPVTGSVPRQCRAFVNALKARYDGGLVSVVLFGSVARGQARATSDIDLVVVMRGWPKSRLDRHALWLRAARQVAEGFAQRVSVVPLTPAEAEHVKPYYLGMLSGYRMLFDRDDFFRAILARLRRRLKELGSERRVDEEGREYWILKKDVKPGEAIIL